MKINLIRQVRVLLRSNPEGLSTTELAILTKTDNNNVRNTLMRMPDVYIDRWLKPQKGQYTAVWCAVVPPDNCPHPAREVVAIRSSTRRDSREDERIADKNPIQF